jgi:hypothetical protein
MIDPREDQARFYAWLLGVVCGAVAAFAAGMYWLGTRGWL